LNKFKSRPHADIATSQSAGANCELNKQINYATGKKARASLADLINQ